MARKTYIVRATPEGKFWALKIEGLPESMFCATQSYMHEGDAGIEVMARDFIALSLEVDENSFDIEITKESEGEAD